ncbi:MAG: alpha/beta hydrolase [Planctomycetia bacterium]|nr:alpha/beta hydrolase [Planctomycetia bacterium]
MRPLTTLAMLMALCAANLAAAVEPSATLNLWPGKPPGETKELPPEADTTKDSDNLIAGRRLQRIGNVSTPTLAIYRPAPELDTGASVVICPGGGHHILAYDLEGTEVAEWLNTIGVTGIVLKYRVPARDQDKRWLAAVQDGQRAVSLTRSNAEEWKLDPKRIGILGFSAGGETAGLTAILEERQYEAADDVDQVSSRPDFAVLIYAGGFAEKDSPTLKPYVKLTSNTPPMFLVHAIDDPVPVANSLLLTLGLKQAGVPAELHVYSTGGHGYGLRQTEQPVTHWADRCGEWLRESGLLKRTP